MSITVPPVLEDAQKTFEVIREIAALDAKRLKAIEIAIRDFNALNDAEKKKAEEARDLIAQQRGLLAAADKASDKLAKERASFLQGQKAFEDSRQSQLDDIAVKKHALDEARAVLEQETANLETVKKQLKVAQDTAAATVQRSLEKEANLLKKEQELQLKEKTLAEREESLSASEQKVAGKLAQLRQIAG